MRKLNHRVGNGSYETKNLELQQFKLDLTRVGKLSGVVLYQKDSQFDFATNFLFDS